MRAPLQTADAGHDACGGTGGDAGGDAGGKPGTIQTAMQADHGVRAATNTVTLAAPAAIRAVAAAPTVLPVVITSSTTAT